MAIAPSLQDPLAETIPVVNHFIDGRVADSEGDGRTAVFDPATGAVARYAVRGTAADVARAVAAAKTAFTAWSQTPPARRAEVMFAFRAALLENAARLASIVTAEHGKTLDDARAELQRGIEVVEFACGIPHLLKGDTTEQVARDVDSYSVHQPLGVCVGITPFNFPAMVPMWMFPLAIACGNTFVLKPSEKDPSLALEMARILIDCGLPSGVFNVVTGGQEAVEALLDHPDVKAVSFVGSTPVARAVYTRASAAGKRVQALGGAKNHLVVMPDADLESAADALIGAAFGSAGERCMAISVAVPVGEETAGALVAMLRSRAANLAVGDGRTKGTEMGPLITNEHRERVISYIDAGVREGAELVLDGRAHAAKLNGDGFFLGPTIFDHVTPGMRIHREEIFGPVLAVVRATSLQDALEIVNGHEFANGAAIFTNDGGAARTFSHEAAAGMVGVNVPIPVPMAFHSFGGWKGSFFGGHNVHGTEGVSFYTRPKTTTVRWNKRSLGASFALPTNS